MAALPELQSVTQLSRYVTRILGANPSKFTLQGTNSYLVHHPSSPSLLLIDTTGPSSSASLSPSALQTYLSSLRSAILAHPAQPAFVKDIILTHWHKDHTGAVRSVVDMLAEMQPEGGKRRVKVWKMPCRMGVAWKGEEGRDSELEEVLRDAEGTASRSKEEDSPSSLAVVEGGRVHALQDGQRFRLSGSSSSSGDENVELQVISTPGHTSDSICLSLSILPPASSASFSSSSTPSSRLLALFTADTVLGHGTAVFASLSHYLRSLSLLVDLLKGAEGEVPLYPGHGEVVEKGLEKVQEYKSHREEREKQVVEALRKVGGGEKVTASELTDQIYASSIPSSLKPAATHGLLLHLAKLEEDGLVERISLEGTASAEGGEQAEQQSHGQVVIPPGWDEGWRWVGGKEGSALVAGRM